MKSILLSVLLLSSSLCYAETEYVHVLASKPQFGTTGMRQVCVNDYQTGKAPQQYIQQNSNIGAVLGAIAGGVIGHSIGGGSGKLIATGVGAAVGAVTGQELASPQTPYSPQPVVHCNMIPGDTVIIGYVLTVRSHGKLNTVTSTENIPVGSLIPVETSLSLSTN